MLVEELDDEEDLGDIFFFLLFLGTSWVRFLIGLVDVYFYVVVYIKLNINLKNFKMMLYRGKN